MGIHSVTRRFLRHLHDHAGHDSLHSDEMMSRDMVDYVVDSTFRELHAQPRYASRLQEPLRHSMQLIDHLIEDMPSAFECSCDAFGADARVHSFFASPTHLREVFSRSRDVRSFFQRSPGAQYCYALLCMTRSDRTRLGVAMKGDLIRRDVLQTCISFDAHELVSPGESEQDARQALKCCVFNGLLDFVRRQALESRTASFRLLDRQRQLQRAQAAAELAQVQHELLNLQPKLDTIDQRMAFLLQTLERSDEYIKSRQLPLTINRMNIAVDETCDATASRLLLSEITVRGKEPRIAALIRFPRCDLLPEKDPVREATLFLHTA